MKRFLKALALVAATACCVCALALAGCGGKSYSGEYHYDNYGTEYGIKVSVKVDDGVIKSVKVVDSDYVEVSAVYDNLWTQENIDNWVNNLNSLLAKYEGKTVEEVLAINVPVGDTGAPETPQTYDGLVITGATQSSGRLLLAVQNALKDYSAE